MTCVRIKVNSFNFETLESCSKNPMNNWKRFSAQKYLHLSFFSKDNFFTSSSKQELVRKGSIKILTKIIDHVPKYCRKFSVKYLYFCKSCKEYKNEWFLVQSEVPKTGTEMTPGGLLWFLLWVTGFSQRTKQENHSIA